MVYLGFWLKSQTFVFNFCPKYHKASAIGLSADIYEEVKIGLGLTKGLTLNLVESGLPYQKSKYILLNTIPNDIFSNCL